VFFLGVMPKPDGSYLSGGFTPEQNVLKLLKPFLFKIKVIIFADL
jgi:hypothetical protein